MQIVPSMNGVGRTIQDAFGSAGDKGGAQAGKNFTSGFSAKIGAVAGVAASVFNKVAGVVASSLNSAIGRADQMNNFPKVMKNLGYSSEDAAASIKKISAALDGLPTTSSAMTGMVQQLAPLTSNLDEATDIALAFNNAMLAGGASTIEQENALTQYTQMLSAGKVDMQAWRSIQAAMPGQLNQVAEAMMGAGHNANDLYEAMKDGTYSFDDFNKTVMRLNDQGFAQYASFAQQAKDATQGIGTAFENVRNRVAKAVQKVIEAIGVENIAGAINNFSSQFGKIGDAAAGMVGYVKDWLVQLYGKLQDNGALQSFKTAWDNIVGIVKQVANLVIDWLKLIPPDGAAAALKLVADILKTLSDILPGLMPFIIAFGTAFATWKTVNATVNGVTKSIGAFTTGIANAKALATEFSSVVTAAGGPLKALWALFMANPIAIVITLVAALVAGLVWFFTQTETGRKAWAAFTSWLSETWTALAEGAKAIWNGLGEFFAGLWQSITQGASDAWNGFVGFLSGLWATISGGISTAWTSITTFLSGVWTGISTTATTIFTAIRDFIVNVFTVLGAFIVAPLQAIQNGINTVFGWILSFITQQMNSTNTVWSTVWTAIYNVVSTIFTVIRNYISTVVNAIRTVIVVFLSLLKGDWSGAWDAIKSFFTTTWDGIKAFLSNILDGIKSVWATVWTAVSTFFTDVWNNIVAFFAPIINGIRNTISTVLNAIKSVWTSIWNAIKSVASTVWMAISSAVSSYINNVRNTIGTVLNAIKSVWTSVWNSVSSHLSNIWHGITSAVSNGIQSVSNTVGRIRDTVLGAVSGAGQWLYDTGRQVIQGLINGIGGAFQWVKNTISNLGSSLVGWAKGVLGIHSPSRIFRDEVGKWIPAGMAQGIDKASGLVADSIDGLTDMVPTVSLKTDTSRLETPLAYQPRIAGGRIAYTVDDRSADYATKQDIIDAIDAALAAGITLNLNDRGGEVMAGKLAKPMSYELNSLAMRGR
ncbi:tape measure protein [Bifidobacterium imperatoris]|uniref:tape measure protein n=1 Tax=Bifidobacterium imperatoris TaxID=2020965 RepID=UPI001FAF83A0|nr:tape measure protein [Bifidobacterium imperatoris]